MIIVLLVEYVVLPQLVGARHDVALLRSAVIWMLPIGLALEVASLLSYSRLSRAVLDPHRRPTFWTLLRVDLTGLGVSHVMPGGGAATVALRYRLLVTAGVRPGDIAAGTAVQTAVSIVVLVALFVGGLVISVPQLSGHVGYEIAGIAAVSVLAALLLLVALMARHPGSPTRWLARLSRVVPVLRKDIVSTTFHELGTHVHGLADDRVLLRRTAAWATANWMLDAACLWICLGAYGYWAPFGPLLAIYAAGNLLAWLPLTPGGLGLVEGVLVPALISFGADSGPALLGVLTWRLAQYWLPIPVAAATYLSLLATRRRRADATQLAQTRP
ncbi:MAG: lysylphosphatidylglycerol synthase transmembrane domain-containing protein [Aeromicrobium sp.]